MADVVSLSAARLQPRADVVEVCRDLLRRAEAGEVRGIAVAAACDAGCDATVYVLGDGGIASLHLALSRLRQRLLDHGE